MAITLNDIARNAGLSISTVSRVLNKKSARSRISRETEKLVLKTAKDLELSPEPTRQRLTPQEDPHPGTCCPGISNPFFAYITKSIQNVSHKMGILWSCATPTRISRWRSSIRISLQQRGGWPDRLAGGPEVYSPGNASRNGTPLVVVDRSFEGLDCRIRWSLTITGERSRLREFLIKNGHRRIAIIQGLPETFTAIGRLRGFLDAHEKHGVAVDPQLVVVAMTSTRRQVTSKRNSCLSLEHRPQQSSQRAT